MLSDRLFALLLLCLPHHLLSRIWWRVVRSRRIWLKNRLIQWVINRYQVDLQEAESANLQDYPNLNAFFVRALKPGVRPVAQDPAAALSPADGTVSQFGSLVSDGVDEGCYRLVQAKDQSFTLSDLLGGDEQMARRFHGGEFCTIYLSPRDYHRLHMPISGRLTRMIHVPGRLFSVQESTARTIPRLYARNERVVNLFETAAGPVAMVLVGAIFVSSIETVWHGVVNLYGERSPLWHVDYPLEGCRAVSIERGEEMGRFNMGSTVVLVAAKGAIEWQGDLTAGAPVRMGEALGRWQSGGVGSGDIGPGNQTL